ncbi:MAG: DNA-deoxyinosine glycosylase [Clostridia bacterium]|nr:DNA-deoxyinosine glycosylase [Clostridia bacterium]
MEAAKQVHNIPPLYDEDSRILVLGSFPSIKSREAAFFYGHPQNRYWKVLPFLLGEPLPETVEEKAAMMHKHHVAMWDSIGSCTITGSSDSSITDVVPNDLSIILDAAPIEAVFTNGAASTDYYNQYIYPVTGIRPIRLPSTSPANAAYSLVRLRTLWGRALAPYLDLLEPVPSPVTERLFAEQDREYGAFQQKLIPNIDPETIIGVRTPVLRKYAKELRRNEPALAEQFLDGLPHRYFDENQLHAFLLGEEKDYERCIAGVKAFLPVVDNWATCDQLSPKALGKNKEALLQEVFGKGKKKGWIDAKDAYTVRFGIGMLLQWFLDEDFSPEFPERVASVRFQNGDETDEYYVNMMIAWYFATALAKQYDAVLPYLQEERLERWTHNKAIQKAVESYRITDEQKAYLKTLRRKKES